MPADTKPLDGKTISSCKCYGVVDTALAAGTKAGRSQGWHTVSDTDNRFTRWNIAAVGATASEDFRNEPNTFGYNLEIDPLNPGSVPA